MKGFQTGRFIQIPISCISQEDFGQQGGHNAKAFKRKKINLVDKIQHQKCQHFSGTFDMSSYGFLLS